jgi:hypothetical protein
LICVQLINFFCFVCPPGLPDGLFSNQKYQFGYIFEGLRMENAGIFYGHLEYFLVIWYMLWPFGSLSFCYIVSRKIWQPWTVCTILTCWKIRLKNGSKKILFGETKERRKLQVCHCVAGTPLCCLVD